MHIPTLEVGGTRSRTQVELCCRVLRLQASSLRLRIACVQGGVQTRAGEIEPVRGVLALSRYAPRLLPRSAHLDDRSRYDFTGRRRHARGGRGGSARFCSRLRRQKIPDLQLDRCQTPPGRSCTLRSARSACITHRVQHHAPRAASRTACSASTNCTHKSPSSPQADLRGAVEIWDDRAAK